LSRRKGPSLTGGRKEKGGTRPSSKKIKEEGTEQKPFLKSSTLRGKKGGPARSLEKKREKLSIGLDDQGGKGRDNHYEKKRRRGKRGPRGDQEASFLFSKKKKGRTPAAPEGREKKREKGEDKASA